MGPLGNPERKFALSLWRFFLAISVSLMPWCSMPLPGGLSSLAYPVGLESLDVVAGSVGSSCSSVSMSYHLVPLYLPKPGNPDPRGHTILFFLAGAGGCSGSSEIDVSGGSSDVGSSAGCSSPAAAAVPLMLG